MVVTLSFVARDRPSVFPTRDRSLLYLSFVGKASLLNRALCLPAPEDDLLVRNWLLQGLP
ncbi:hypothetical protein [Nostoc sp.]|uniref:hypothetical protein n=1 Tax=Nostoc sp. TaxID=1180 RepID=UPI002FFD3963